MIKMVKCEMCGKEVAEEEIVEIEVKGVIKSVCEDCATGMKGLL